MHLNIGIISEEITYMMICATFQVNFVEKVNFYNSYKKLAINYLRFEYDSYILIQNWLWS